MIGKLVQMGNQEFVQKTDGETPIAALGLEYAIEACLRKHGIRTVSQLCALPQIQLQALKGLGRVSIDRIYAALKRRVIVGAVAEYSTPELVREESYEQLPAHENRVLALQHARQCGVLREGVARLLAKASRVRREVERADAYIEPDQIAILLNDLISEATTARDAARKTRRGPMVRG